MPAPSSGLPVTRDPSVYMKSVGSHLRRCNREVYLDGAGGGGSVVSWGVAGPAG